MKNVYLIIESIERFNFWIRLKQIKKVKILTIKESILNLAKREKLNCKKFDFINFNKKYYLSKKNKKKTLEFKNRYLKIGAVSSLLNQIEKMKLNNNDIVISWSDTNILLNCIKEIKPKIKFFHYEIANIDNLLLVDNKGVNINSEFYNYLKKLKIKKKTKKIPNKLFKTSKYNSHYRFLISDIIDIFINKSFLNFNFFIEKFKFNILSLINNYIINFLSDKNYLDANTLIIGQLSNDWNMQRYKMSNIKIIKKYLKKRNKSDIPIFKPHPKEVSTSDLFKTYFFCLRHNIIFSKSYITYKLIKIYTHTSSHIYNFIGTNKKIIFISESLQKQIFLKGINNYCRKKFMININYYSKDKFSLKTILND